MSGPFATDADIERAIRQDREWHRAACPSSSYQPRVFVGDCNHVVNRRPFKRGGHWCARNAGVARLLRPVECADGWLAFPPFYGRNDADAALARARSEHPSEGGR